MQLATRQQRGVDWKNLVASALSADVNAEIDAKLPVQDQFGRTNKLNQFADTTTRTFADDAVNSEIETHHFDAATAAANALGTYAGNTLAAKAQKEVSEYAEKRHEREQYAQWQKEQKALSSRESSVIPAQAGIQASVTDDTNNFGVKRSSLNPAARKRQVEQDAMLSRHQRWSDEQKQKQTLSAAKASNSSNASS